MGYNSVADTMGLSSFV